MFTHEIWPRFSETDALGHINNTVLPVWFEEARTDLFRIFNPGLTFQKWNLILRKYEIDFLVQITHTRPVTIETTIEKIGTKSIAVLQKAFQESIHVATGRTVMIFFDYKTNTTAEIPDNIRRELENHLA